ncbi:DUF4874 domain-containing protein [Gelidibacter salicanalis]|uniref:DUF4874 domain-containing protein n=1 Tax=Gelidibacter salicanalis TaxID=291193 RepID=A0A934NK43_9FLAO|nr:DUF4874 domain-containing protein [Gelidibacter salicanalis]MBJ7879227.1 DUF4874 domain-containing protein [Gelidibacter salicanalis]
MTRTLLIFLAVILQSAFSTSQNLLINSSFDTGGDKTFTLAPWRASGNAGVWETEHSVSKPKAVKLMDGAASVEQLITGLKPNTEYRFSGWVYTKGVNKAHLAVKDFLTTTTGEVTTANSSSGYEFLTVNFTTGKKATSAKVIFSTNQKDAVYGDDFALEALPIKPNIFITNGGFEERSLEHWLNATVAFNSIEITKKASEVHSGKYAVKASGTGILEQSQLNLKAGTSYVLKAWAKTDADHVATIGIKNFTGGIMSSTLSADTSSNTYKELSVPFTTGVFPNEATLFFELASGTAFFDSFTITEVSHLGPLNESHVSTETMLSNPERGFRFEQIVQVPDLNDPWNLSKHFDMDTILSDWEKEMDATDGHVRLAQWYIYLSEFNDTPLSQEALDAIQKCFDAFRNNGYKMLLRFTYQAPEAQAPYTNVIPTASRILEHLDQLKPLIAANVDVIHVYQMGLIGAWGEWHSFGNAYNQKDKDNLVTKVLEVLPPSRQTHMRLVSDRAAIRSVSDAVKDTRIGFHNDFFGDRNTYAANSSGYYGGNDYEIVKHKSHLLMIDGESGWSRDCNTEDGCIWQVSELFDVYEILKQFLDHHYTSYSLAHGYYANNAYWKRLLLSKENLDALNIPYHPEYFNDNKGNLTNRTAYEFIRDHLGYRLYFKPGNESFSQNSNQLNYVIDIQNYGFSALHNPRQVHVVLLDVNDNIVTSDLSSSNPSTWQPYAPGDENYATLTHTISGSLMLPKDLTTSTDYKIGIWLADPILKNNKMYDIQLANRTDMKIIENDNQKINILKFNILLNAVKK